MTTAAVFDTLALAKKLRVAGFTQQQAEVQVEVMAEFLDANVATKQDINELRRDMQDLKKDLTIRMGSMIAGAVVFLPVMFKLLNLV